MPTPRYPNFAGKHAEQALFSAADFVAYQRQVGALDDREVPGGAVLCYQPSLYDHVISDSLADLVWSPRFHDPAVQAGLFGLYLAAVTALTAVPES